MGSSPTGPVGGGNVMKVVCVLIGLIMLLKGFLYATGFKDSLYIDGQEISGFFVFGLIFIIVPFIF